MKDDATQLALREWRRHLLHPLTLTALAAVSGLLGIVGPFGTLDLLSLPERLAYWGTLVVVGYLIGYLISYALLRSGSSASMRVVRVFLAGISTGLAMSLVVIGLNRLVFGFLPDLSDLPGFATTTLAISLIVMAVLDYFSRNLAAETAGTTPAPAKTGHPPLLDRLPLDKRAPLIALSVEDHYVRVRTQKGEDMLLMRLADAIREVGPTPGAQVHRSHWAAFTQVSKVTRLGDRAILHMSDGAEIPVSRSNLPKVKEAGLLP